MRIINLHHIDDFSLSEDELLLISNKQGRQFRVALNEELLLELCRACGDMLKARLRCSNEIKEALGIK